MHIRRWTLVWLLGPFAVEESEEGAKALESGIAIDCFYERAAGEAEVPAAALASLSATEASAMIYATRVTHVVTGRYDVSVLVNTGGIFHQATVR